MVCMHHIFTELAPRQIQSLCCDVCVSVSLSVCQSECVSPPLSWEMSKTDNANNHKIDYVAQLYDILYPERFKITHLV